MVSPEIFAAVWYSIKKVQCTDSYEFLLANKKYVVNAVVLRTILDIYPRVEGVNFTDVPYDDTTLSFLNKLGEDCQEYGLPIPETMLTETIKQSESYQMYTKYSTSQIPPKKSRGKGSQRKKTADDSQETVDVSEESEPEPESVKRKTSSKRRVKKKVTLSADDNIISDDPDTALELGKSISKTKAEEAEAARQVHATHARIVTESVPEPTKRRKSGKVTSDPPKKLKGTRGSSEGTGTIPGVPDESTVVSATSSEGTEQESEYSEEDKLDDEEKDDKEGDADDEDDETESDEDDIYKYKIRMQKIKEVTNAAKADAKKTLEVKDDAKKTESLQQAPTYLYLQVLVINFLNFLLILLLVSTVKDTIDVEINSLLEVKIQSEVHHIQSLSMLTVPVFVIFEPSVLTLVQESPLKAIVTSLPHPSVSTTPSIPQQTTTKIPTPTITIDAPIITIVVLKSDALSAVQLRVAKLEKDVSELKKIDLSAEALAALKTQVPSVVDNYLGSKVRDVFQKELKKHTADLIQKYSLQQIPELPKKQTPTVDLEQESEKTPSEILKIKKEQAEKQKMPKFTIKSTDKAALKEYDQKSALYQTMHANKSFNRNPANHRLYHALMEALIEDENAMDKGVADTVQDHKRKHDDDEDPPAGPNQGKKTKRRRTKESESSKKPSTTKETPKGKAPSKGSKTGKSASAKEPVEEPIAEVVMDDAGDDVVHDDDQPQDASEPKTAKTPNPEWFTQPPRPPTPDPEWNKRQVVLDQPEQPWFNQMVSATKDPLTFDDLMATPIDFSKYVLNRLKIDNLTQDILLGPAYNLLKGTCSSSIELEYHFQECFNALTDRLDWNNPEGDRYPFDLSKPLPLQGHPGHLTVAADYFFNNDLEYLKSSDPERTYTTSITKTKAARYEIEGIEDMVPTLWSPTKVGYDKDALKGIKHWGEGRKLWHRSQLNKFSKHNVYSTKKILGVKSVSVKKLHGYGHLEEIVVKRADRQFYKFKEGDFVDLHLNDIEDMLLLAVQHKLFHLIDNDIVDFIVALRMFTRSLVIKKRVEDLQLGVESYQKKLNITPPQQTFPINSHLKTQQLHLKIASPGNSKSALEQAGIIFDSWANQHLTYADKDLVNAIDISYLKIKVSRPNGIEAFITKDSMNVKVMGIDKQVRGLYYFDKYQDSQDLDHVNFFDEVLYESLDTPNDNTNINAHPQSEGSNSSNPDTPTVNLFEDD
ncbi:hypothetical protein Tco_1219085 [Tanacetum coccineum]